MEFLKKTALHQLTTYAAIRKWSQVAEVKSIDWITALMDGTDDILTTMADLHATEDSKETRKAHKLWD